MNRIKVMVVDDSAVVRQVLVELLQADAGIEVIAAVSDPLFAMQRMKSTWPDVIVLDVEMPRMDGVTFLRQLMQQRPTPVIICSTLTEAGAPTTLEALAAGAVNVITKPKLGLKQFLGEAAHEITAAVRSAVHANVKRLAQRATVRPATVVAKNSADVILAPASERAMTRTTEHIVAIGTSTGGTQALEQVLSALPKTCPGMVIVQHMPPQFTAAFAQRLNGICQIEVREARSGDRLVPGCALIAPGGKHMMMQRNGAQYTVSVIEGPPVSRHCPSVDVLFRSAAKVAGRNALGIIMTGMGDDGARGLKEMRDAGSATIAQDEKSCVVFGMPKEAIRLGGAERVLALEELASAIVRA
jgi:two-component system, chemotaxis family, protein-glutamate methylesterase/glutaminase